MIAHLQDDSRSLLLAHDARPNQHPVWGGPGWKVFLDHPDDVRRTIHYINENPTKAHLPCQLHEFITSYNDWPLHQRN